MLKLKYATPKYLDIIFSLSKKVQILCINTVFGKRVGVVSCLGRGSGRHVLGHSGVSGILCKS